ncbi:hypothetical protein [Tropicibacter sp. Alg240-R139]|uniref:hypothetical protein n=1 Tax=Tropicibacter sp. Alg240-R139 TaxID=2305991 RepID=UPI0013DEA915|nr:hypothetical protein [Tropicibacter sp. Alg240-R139]
MDIDEVGQNLQDHVYASHIAKTTKAHSINHQIKGLGVVPQVLRYALTRKGHLSMGVSSACAFTAPGSNSMGTGSQMLAQLARLGRLGRRKYGVVRTFAIVFLNWKDADSPDIRFLTFADAAYACRCGTFIAALQPMSLDRSLKTSRRLKIQTDLSPQPGRATVKRT